MSDILEDLSTPALVKAIKANRFEWYEDLGRSPKAEFYDSPSLTWLLSGTPFPLMNTVIRTQLTRDNVDEIIEETVAHFKSKDVTSFTWAVVELCLWRAAEVFIPFEPIGFNGLDQCRCREVL